MCCLFMVIIYSLFLSHTYSLSLSLSLSHTYFLSLFPSPSPLQFQFKNVRFMMPQEQKLEVTNTGRRPVHVSFIPKLDEKKICKPWLEVKPMSAVIHPCKLETENS